MVTKYTGPWIPPAMKITMKWALISENKRAT